MKNSGKSTLANLIAKEKNMKVVSTDSLLELNYEQIFNKKLSFRDMYKVHGKEFVAQMDENIINLIAGTKPKNLVIDLGGGPFMNPINRQVLKKLGKFVWTKPNLDKGYEMLIQNGIPAFFKYPEEPRRSYDEIIEERYPIYESLVDYKVEFNEESPEEVYEKFERLVLSE